MLVLLKGQAHSDLKRKKEREKKKESQKLAVF